MAKVKCPKCFHVNADGQSQCVKCGTALPRIRIDASPDPPGGHKAPGAEAVQFRRGQVLSGRYTVLNLIGRGGMGCIYKVHDNTLGEDVALKTLLPQFVQDKLVVERFFNEARIARRMAHPNIVRVHDIGTTGEVVYISMEYLEGRSLRTVLESQPEGRQLPVKEALHVFDELCAALEYAHQFTVHRDIKPENVMIGKDGNVKLMDFGISKLMANTRLTGASIVMGTPFYMSPEQLRNSRDVDARADIYSVGVMLYEVLTGNMPTGVPKPASQVLKDAPPALDAIVAKCVEPDPKGRYQNAAELRAAILPIRKFLLENDGGQAVTRRHAAVKHLPFRKAAGFLLCLAVVAGMAAGVYALEEHRRGLLAHLPDAPPGQAVPSGETDSSFARYERLVARVQNRARTTEHSEDAVEQADKLWAAAQDELKHDEQRAVGMATRALQYYLVPLMWDKNMDFVPHGDVTIGEITVNVPPFFIDTTETTVAQFGDFCQNVKGGWKFPPELSGNENDRRNEPATWVSYYDAQAFAAWDGLRTRASIPKLLPTEAQWTRAAGGTAEGISSYPWGKTWKQSACNANRAFPGLTQVRYHKEDRTEYGSYDLTGNAAEWTRSVGPNGETVDNDPFFGTLMTIKGGSFRSDGPVSLADAGEAYFEERRIDLGFRCVLEIPDAPDAIERLLTRLH